MATKITVKSHGSIRVEGEFEMFDVDGNKFDLGGRTKVSLCRCGHSKDMPFCDKSHHESGFHSEIKAHALLPLEQKSTESQRNV
jgi:CDGSH-type Zn-finger protein